MNNSAERPFKLTEERDACGVGFVYHPQSGRRVVELSLSALAKLEHRGACGADRDSGDGAGILTAIPWRLLESEGYPREQIGAVGTIYFPRGHEADCRVEIEKLLAEHNLTVIGWRPVPVDLEVLGELAKATCPSIEHVIIGVPKLLAVEFEHRLMIARKQVINLLRARPGREEFYIASLSTRTIVYKGMVRSSVLPLFYKDLTNELFESNFSVFHRRFSTNTFPRWALAQPFRMLGHNGEINTLVGNRNWIRAREPVLEHPAWRGKSIGQQPVVYTSGSDSGNLDNAMEMLVRAGHTPEAALMQLMPEAYRNQPALKEYPAIADFYDYFSALQEPWDGPALIVYSDGITVGAMLDRNGLRPARYSRYEDGLIVVSSETGVVDYPESNVFEKGRLGPGQILQVEIGSGQLSTNWEVKNRVAQLHPYGHWVASERKTLTTAPFKSELEFTTNELHRTQTLFGYGREDVDTIVAGMAEKADDPVYSMGDDTPLAVLSAKPRVIFDYFKQRFAQVTNPPIDPLREKLVMSLDSFLGQRSNLLHPGAQAARSLHLQSPILNENEILQVKSLGGDFASEVLSLNFDPTEIKMDVFLHRLCMRALAAVEEGKRILILSDKKVGEEAVAIPPLVAVGAVHSQLIRAGLRLKTSIVVETGQCWSIHQTACLLGFGAQAICPYLAFETVRHWFSSAKIQALHKAANEAEVTGSADEQTTRDAVAEKYSSFIGLTLEKAQHNYKVAVENGLLKVMSKMGISALMSYIGAQIFECIGLGPSVVRRCFAGTSSRIGGMELKHIEQDVLHFHKLAFNEEAHDLPIDYGFMQSRREGEYHGNNPAVVKALHKALNLTKNSGTAEQRQESFDEYSRLIRERRPAALRDLLKFQSDREPVSLDSVESAVEIVKRFCTGGMSLGALSKETHEVLAVAMNRIGGKSNSGEGGEDPLRYHPIEDITPEGQSKHFPGLKQLKPGDYAGSAIRQVASARFGVTPEYLVTSQQLEIKVAQGAKPGEGGQLPGHKVSPYIASLRRAKPGTTLISPPPHHDIYSIEDLAQLIFDLKQVNEKAKISVKLVSQIGIGTVSAGVAKANADIIQISGHDGGTGASPVGSIKHAGGPWELGLSETQQVLLANNLRDRVLLRVDGGFRSGWEVVMAAMMGADEFGFGSIALIAEGCIMARVCHTNNCPVGITSQKEELRKKFIGTPEPLVDFFMHIADEVRFVLASLGYCSLDEILGRSDLLSHRTDVELRNGVALDLNTIISATSNVDLDHCSARKGTHPWGNPPATPHSNGPTLDDALLSTTPLDQIISSGGSFQHSCAIANTDRSVGSRISGHVARQWGDEGFNGSIVLDFNGVAGQSFGAFNIKNLNLVLTGESNDYVGKGMSGGSITIKAPTDAKFAAGDNVIVGNTCLYGATGGALFVQGRAGERFAVRNSGAVAVVEGVGDHACEYMTGGIVAVLGEFGRNFSAGMTGGIAYVLDVRGDFPTYLNQSEGRTLDRLNENHADALNKLIQQHQTRTNSRRAAEILENWQHFMPLFWQVSSPSGSEQHMETLTTFVAEVDPNSSCMPLSVEHPTLHGS